MNNFSFEDTLFQVKTHGNKIDYSYYNGDYYNISLVLSKNAQSTTQTTSWNKYGLKSDKRESRVAGIYIMANDGNLTNVAQTDFLRLYVARGKIFSKIQAVSRFHSVLITVKN